MSPLPREDKSRRSVASEKNRQNQEFRPKSRKYATNLGQKHSKIGHVENIEKADVSCETMQNSPKAGQEDKTGCARLRLQKARLRAGVSRQKKSAPVRAEAAQCAGKGGMARKTSERTVLDRRVQGNSFKGRRRQMAQERRKGGKAVQAAVCHRAARRGRSSYKWADNGKEGEKSTKKLTIENKFHVKQFFAARVSHET